MASEHRRGAQPPPLGPLEEGPADAPAPAGSRAAGEPSDVRTVILKVRRAGYVPPGVTVRAIVAPDLLTVDTTVAALEELRADPDVVSIAHPEKIGPAHDA